MTEFVFVRRSHIVSTAFVCNAAHTCAVGTRGREGWRTCCQPTGSLQAQHKSNTLNVMNVDMKSVSTPPEVEEERASIKKPCKLLPPGQAAPGPVPHPLSFPSLRSDVPTRNLWCQVKSSQVCNFFRGSVSVLFCPLSSVKSHKFLPSCQLADSAPRERGQHEGICVRSDCAWRCRGVGCVASHCSCDRSEHRPLSTTATCSTLHANSVERFVGHFLPVIRFVTQTKRFGVWSDVKPVLLIR